MSNDEGMIQQCSANLRNPYIAAESYIQQNGSWPQIGLNDSDTDEEDYAMRGSQPLNHLVPSRRRGFARRFKR
jgi:hypothetical protein